MKNKSIILLCSSLLMLGACSNSNPTPSSSSEVISSETSVVIKDEYLTFIDEGKIRIDFVPSDTTPIEEGFTYGGAAITSGAQVAFNQTGLAFTGTSTVDYVVYFYSSFYSSTSYVYHGTRYSPEAGHIDELCELIKDETNNKMGSKSKVYIAISTKAAGGWTHGLSEELDGFFAAADGAK